MQQYIGYYRVSTRGQGKSGLGLEAQRTAVRNFLKGKQATEIDSFTEVESGKKFDRPILRQAIDKCKQTGSKLLVAKLDRLSRNAKFLFTLKDELEDAGIGFTIADMPEANTLVLGFMASLAQYEAELISTRTKEGLTEAKRKGKKIGSPQNLTKEARQKALSTIRDKARSDVDTRKAFHFIQPRREQGWSYAKIASALNKEGYRTRNNKLFFPSQTRRVFMRYLDVNNYTLIKSTNE
ncbi:MAG: resolvase [Balneola sp.]|nr:MAG: resolvase [Balneola sp.]